MGCDAERKIIIIIIIVNVNSVELYRRSRIAGHRSWI